jgi:transcriptional regulator of arginine metabolism
MGGAQPVAASIDSEDWDEVVGTIAGDNTVLIICPDSHMAESLKNRIEAYIA